MFVEVVLLSFRSATSRMRVRMFWRKSAAKEVVTATGSSGGCTMREVGSKTSRRIMAMLGLMPVTECGVIRYAANISFVNTRNRAELCHQLTLKVASLVAMQLARQAEAAEEGAV